MLRKLLLTVILLAAVAAAASATAADHDVQAPRGGALEVPLR